MDFQEFNKIARLFRDCVITEKIDGTNAQIRIERKEDDVNIPGTYCDTIEGVSYRMWVGSRNRYVTPKADNYGFARWAFDHGVELISGLGEGLHFGEWWGAGIQRRYDLSEKRFSLFNTGRWNSENLPSCVGVVPVLYEGPFSTEIAAAQIGMLIQGGSVAAPGFADPEGIVIYHKAADKLFKVTCEGDESPKGAKR